MSLTFRRVTKIHKRSRKSRSPSRITEKDSTKPSINDTTYLENFPSLNTVYKSGVFGTPIKYHFSCGSDRNWDVKYRVKCHVLVFMEEYGDKSVEELRWEDYQCNRKGRQLFEEKRYLKSLCNASRDNVPESDNVASSSPVLDDALLTSSVDQVKGIAHVESTSSREGKDHQSMAPAASPQPPEVPNNDPTPRPALTPHEEEVQIVKNNLLRFFANADPDATIPYDFLPNIPKFYMPCADLKFVYQNARPCVSALKADPPDVYEGLLEKKYTMDNRFSQDYFWKKINPYAGGGVTLEICRGKNVLSGRYIFEYSSDESSSFST